MRTIDLNTWPRRQHFEMFIAFDYPHFGLCANLDITRLHAAAKTGQHSLTATLTYLLARTANSIPEFRYRIRQGPEGVQVVEHEAVHPSITVLANDDLFSFCTLAYTPSFRGFISRLTERMAAVKADPSLQDEPGQDNLLFMTSIPWVSFTGVQHPIHMHPADSTPRIAWGKFFVEGGQVRLPLAVQAHHGLMDGLHMGRFYEQAQSLADQPEVWME